ncbi:MAG: sensor histidine kinase [Thermoanaerobaculia bacterium]
MRGIVGYYFSIVCVGAALLLSELLGVWAQPDISAFYVVAVLVVASVAGLGPALFATVLSATSIAFAQVGWTFAVDVGLDDVLRAGIFIVVAVTVSSLVARRRAAEADLRDAVAQLKRADRAKDDFLAMLSHELRTPLTSILGWAAVLGEKDLDATTAETAVESIRQSAKSQQYLIDDLLDFSRMRFSKFRIDVNPVDLVPLVHATTALIKPAAEAKHVELRTEVPEEACVIEGDAQRIKQVIWNFLSNAVKFTPPGGRVVVRVEEFDSQFRVVVSDNGEGIEPRLLASVFDRFQQGSGAAAKGGLGLGLSIARYVVEAHHGTVTALSAGRGKGATFIAGFPRPT